MEQIVSHAYFSDKGLWLIGRVSEKLMARNMFMGTAESCTGGLVATLCTNVQGSSRWFAGGVVAYANEVKSRLLGVEAQTIAGYGAVSGRVVEAMASGGLRALGADVCVAVSGIAGPDGGTAEKPVGTVWLAAAIRTPNGDDVAAASFCRHFPGDRGEVRMAAALAAIGAVETALESVA